jgi:hypothetical protein
MSSRVIDDEFEDPTADELWDFNDNLLDESVSDEDDIADSAEGEPDPDEALEADSGGQAPGSKRRGSAAGKAQNGVDADSPPSWRIIEMRREQHDLDDFLKEVYDE